jgi:hypothetical protein
MLSLNDQLLLEKKGISEEKIETQLAHFQNGFPFMKISKPATINDGIEKLSSEKMEEYASIYRQSIENGLTVTKFVPASGAATRMFKSLFDAVNDFKASKPDFMNKASADFIANLDKFPFATELKQKAQACHEFTQHDINLINCLLSETGLNYGNLPKGVLKFHTTNGKAITPAEEHLLEGALYCKDHQGKISIHFTVSPEHEHLFKKIINDTRQVYENRFNIECKVSYSHQKSNTDTIAVTPDNKVFRQDNGSLLFRPAGHGALIENLNDIHADIVFIKNIDNVVPEHLTGDTVNYKKALAGILCAVRNDAFEILHAIKKESEQQLKERVGKLERLHPVFIPEFIKDASGDNFKDLIFSYLNRPIRVCGMVRNQGEPGGGPFWVSDANDNLSLQIVESSQINLNDADSKRVFDASTHFNPVDLVCSIRNYKDQKFDLTLYVDPDTGFISDKSLNGKQLKALELPGLWNGAMAHWLTMFVEVPLSTFNPVKTVNDLLRPQHQPL